MQLIAEWRQWHRMWSVRFTALGTALLGFIGVFPDAFFHIWALVPSDVRAVFPEDFVQWIGITCLILGIISRVIKQNSLRSGLDSAGMGQKTEPGGTSEGSGYIPGSRGEG